MPDGSTSANSQPKPANVTLTNKPPSTASYEDKKFNVVMYGIKESPPKTSKNLTIWKMIYNQSPMNLLKLTYRSRPVQSRIASVWADTNLMLHAQANSH